ncbi:MAG TPA: hypothetical protein VGP72_15960 [Planctomycetota bacterium]|jgi:hypothetical protein
MKAEVLTCLLLTALPLFGGDEPFYQRKDTLEQTLLDARGKYQSWSTAQKQLLPIVRTSPWFAASGTADKLPINLAAKAADGNPVWAPRELKDGALCKLSSSGQPLCLLRTLTAQTDCQLVAGIGGGDSLRVLLNGTEALLQATKLEYERYGCAMVWEGTRVDQVLASLKLKAGANTLLIELSPSREPSFYFSLTPDPVPALWRQIRADFPQEKNPLLELAPANWFEKDGWFVAQDTKLEQALLKTLNGTGDTLEQCIKASFRAKARTDVERLERAVAALATSHPDYPAQEFGKRLAGLRERADAPASEATAQQLLADLERARREMLVDKNPLLAGSEVLFVRRYTYDSRHYYDDFINGIRDWGGNLAVLSLKEGTVREIAPAEMADGVFDRYDLSFDAKRVVFGYRRPKAEGFRLYEIGVDGRGLRQVTVPPADEEARVKRFGNNGHGYWETRFGYWTDDLHPCYLPDGGIAFSSTRLEHEVLCHFGRELPTTNLFRVNRDGGGLRPLSHGALSEFTTTLMEDGRLFYNRWEYIYKGIAAVQPLWTMRPDGSAGEEFYGNEITNPGVFWQQRQVPGHPNLAVCIGCGHEPMGVGQILLLDLSKNKRTTEPITSLTPDVKIEGLRGIYHQRNGKWREDYWGPLYADPYPLSDKFFLVACNPDKRYNDKSAYGIYLLDVFGNRVLIHRDAQMSCWQPMPLRSRTAPPVLPSIAEPNPDAPGVVFMRDVYRGLDGVKRGAVKYIRVMEQIPRPWAANLPGDDNYPGHLPVGAGTHIWIAVLQGVAPVNNDGSACFEVPSKRNIFLQALDENFMEVQRMRTFVNFQPGESRSCIGCHETRTQAPAVGQALQPATPQSGQPAPLMPQPGDSGPRPLSYAHDVQPVLDKHCLRCHNDQKIDGNLNLGGGLTAMFNRSYDEIMSKKLVNVIHEWVYPGGNGCMANVEAVPPYTYGSHKSKLVQVLLKGHYECKLPKEDFARLVTWIDSGAQYYGSYFGRRNLKSKGQPDFRPLPTIQSACGCETAQ